MLNKSWTSLELKEDGQYIDRVGSYLFLGAKVCIDRKVYVVHEALDHGHGVGSTGLRVDGLLHDDGGDVPELGGQLRLPLLARNLELPFLQYLTAATVTKSSR